MAWTAPMTAVANAVFTAAQFNTHVRDNLLETAPAKALTEGGYFVTSGTNTIEQRIVGQASIDTSEGTSSSSFVDLTTAGPSVTVTTGSRALCFVTVEIGNSSASQAGRVGIAVSGATTRSVDGTKVLRLESSGTAEFQRATGTELITGLNSGNNTFKLQYASTSGTTNFNFRNLVVLPL